MLKVRLSGEHWQAVPHSTQQQELYPKSGPCATRFGPLARNWTDFDIGLYSPPGGCYNRLQGKKLGERRFYGLEHLNLL